jgi:hypothetical protein
MAGPSRFGSDRHRNGGPVQIRIGKVQKLRARPDPDPIGTEMAGPSRSGSGEVKKGTCLDPNPVASSRSGSETLAQKKYSDLPPVSTVTTQTYKTIKTLDESLPSSDFLCDLKRLQRKFILVYFK